MSLMSLSSLQCIQCEQRERLNIDTAWATHLEIANVGVADQKERKPRCCCMVEPGPRSANYWMRADIGKVVKSPNSR